MTSRFVWADLSTFDLASAEQFYRDCLGWSFSNDGQGYHIGSAGSTASAGVYVMPEQFQKIKMPSFWMSYIQVDDINATVSKAQQCGAKIELTPQPGPDGGLIALIRDPSGAGFTCYQGELGEGQGASAQHGLRLWHELHVSSLDKVKTFYKSVFNWHIAPAKEPERYLISASPHSAQPIAAIQVSSNAVKGDKEYWGVYFAVDDLSRAGEVITKAGGELIEQAPVNDLPTALAFDPQGAAFYIQQVSDATQSNKANEAAAMTPTTPHKPSIKWRSMIGLIGIAVAILLDANWVWGLFFLFWVIPDIKYAETHFMERVRRQENPLLYWLIIATWLGLSGYLLLDPLVSR
ncbi:VOC family protein [Aliagarivorans marinus]|uniref:VOC family protein n=1 Tax=Aliagarivorans marinus TaxID=561965 RepID=UPI0004009983|nr:VOC family protein [Aliagarivorans marinus]